MSGWCSGQHSCISCRWLGFNSPHGPTNFQLSFFSFSSFWGHQTFLLKTSNLRNHLSFRLLRWQSHKSYKGASIKAYLLLQDLSQDFITSWLWAWMAILDHQGQMWCLHVLFADICWRTVVIFSPLFRDLIPSNTYIGSSWSHLFYRGFVV